MDIQDPRLRSKLRQADKVADAGKKAAAEQLYRQIVEEAPEIAPAWLGLGRVMANSQERQQAFEKALDLNPNYAEAAQALAELRGEPIPEWAQPPEPEVEEAVEEVVQSVVPEPAPESHEHTAVPTTTQDDYELVCYRHPNRSTALRCYNCGKPICSSCAVKTPVGYSCPDCIREKEEVFFNAGPIDYLIAPAICLVLSLIAGYLVVQFTLGGSFFLIFIMLFVGGIAGRFIGRLSKQAIGRRRGRYLPHVMAGMVILGTGIWLLPFLIPIIASGLSGLFAFLGPGIYLFAAASAVFAYMK